MLVVLALRADFYGHALLYPELASSLRKRQVVVEPMTPDQLRKAIVGPARAAKLAVDPGLSDLLLSELAPRAVLPELAPAAHESGALPLLSHALRSTWERARGNQLTVADYQAAGGIRNAIAYTAEAAYAELDDHQQEVARRLFLRLVHVSDDTPLTRAKVPLDELPGWSEDDGTKRGVLARFVEERLVTLDEQLAQITHEALLSAWPRLRAWISADQEGLKIRHRIASAATAWQEAGRDDASLLRGGQLAIAAAFARSAANRDSLGPRAREFIDFGLAHEQAREAVERRQVRRLRRLIAALTVLLLLAGGTAAYAFQQRHEAGVARHAAHCLPETPGSWLGRHRPAAASPSSRSRLP